MVKETANPMGRTLCDHIDFALKQQNDGHGKQMSGCQAPTGQAVGVVTKGGTRDSAEVAPPNPDGGGDPGTETLDTRAQNEAARRGERRGKPGAPNEAGGSRQRHSPRRDTARPSRRTPSRQGPGEGRPGAPRSHAAARASAVTSEREAK